MTDSFLPHPGPDIVIQRTLFLPAGENPLPVEIVQANVPRLVVWHSPDGYEIGFGGSGPADLALNILQKFLPGAETECNHGTRCSRAAAHLHLLFMRDFLANMPRDGGSIEAKVITAWIAGQLADYPIQLTDAVAAAPEVKAEPEEWVADLGEAIADLKRLTILTADFLYLAGHRLPDGKPIHFDPRKLDKVLRELDQRLEKQEKRFGIGPMEKVRRAG